MQEERNIYDITINEYMCVCVCAFVLNSFKLSGIIGRSQKKHQVTILSIVA